LEAEVRRLQDVVGDTDAKELRNDDTWRAAVVTNLEAIETNLSAMIEHRPGRKYRFAVE